MNILFSGGGTMGSVSPLLAIVDELRRTRPGMDEFLWVGTEHGPERAVVESCQIRFVAIKGARFRRYWSVENMLDIFRFFHGMWQAKKIVSSFRPSVLLTAGSFVCVPVARACAKFQIPYLVHQQDVLPGLANKIMAKKASVITVSLEASLSYFPKEKTVWTGNPVRSEVMRGDRTRASEIFELQEALPTILFMGGGTGAFRINELVIEVLGELTQRYQILHLTGAGKEISPERLPVLPPFQRMRYRAFEFLFEDMKHAYALADLVVCRASFSTISELSALGKSAVLIPIPDSHQVQNAVFFKRNNAAFMLDQKKLTGAKLFSAIQTLFEHPEEMKIVANNLHAMMKLDASQRVVEEVMRFLNERGA